MVGSLDLGVDPVGMGENVVERTPKAPVIADYSHFPVSKSELLVFDEIKPQWWIRRCEKLFNIHQIGDNQRVALAATFLNDMGDIWFQGCSGVREDHSWEELVRGLCERFGERRMVDIVEEFNKLKHRGTKR